MNDYRMAMKLIMPDEKIGDEALYRYDRQPRSCVPGDMLHNNNDGYCYKVMEKLGQFNFLMLNIGTGELIVGIGVQVFRKVPIPDDSNLDYAMRIIDRFCFDDYLSNDIEQLTPDYADIYNVKILQAKAGLDKNDGVLHDIEISVDLMNYSLITDIDGKTLMIRQYDNIDDFIRQELLLLNRNSLITFKAADINRFNNKHFGHIYGSSCGLEMESVTSIKLTNGLADIDIAKLRKEFGDNKQSCDDKEIIEKLR